MPAGGHDADDPRSWLGAAVSLLKVTGPTLFNSSRKETENVSTANIIRLVQTVLAALVAAFAISVVLAGHWWTTPPPSVNVPTLKQEVLSLLQDTLNTGDAFKDYGITADDDLTLINTDLNKYDGLVTVHTRKGTQKYLELTAWADPTGAMFYQMNPTSAANLVEAASKEEKTTQCSGSSC